MKYGSGRNVAAFFIRTLSILDIFFAKTGHKKIPLIPDHSDINGIKL